MVTTAGITLFRRQGLPPPWSPRSSSSSPLPLIIYGASGALGAFAVKLASASNIHPIIAIAGSSSSHLVPLLDESKGDALVDYRVGAEDVKKLVKEKLDGKSRMSRNGCADFVAQDWNAITHLMLFLAMELGLRSLRCFPLPQMQKLHFCLLSRVPTSTTTKRSREVFKWSIPMSEPHIRGRIGLAWSSNRQMQSL